MKNYGDINPGFIQKIAIIFQGLFKDYLLGILYKNAHSHSILTRLLGLNCLLHQLLYIFQFTYLKLIVNYWIKHWALCVNNLFPELWFIFCPRQAKSIKEHFPGHYIQSWRKFKDFLRTSPKIQGLLKTACVNPNNSSHDTKPHLLTVK